jgi:hypothetical protein
MLNFVVADVYNNSTTLSCASGIWEVRCNKGLWAVSSYMKEEVIRESVHYFLQYYSDGEYDDV